MASTSGTTFNTSNKDTARFEAHMRFICPECGIEHNTQQSWRRHLNEEHNYLSKTVEDLDFKVVNERYHECQVCHTWVANAHQAIALLQYHRFLHLPYSRTYRCRHCASSFTRKRALCDHIGRYHEKEVQNMENERRSREASEVSKTRNARQNPEFYLRFRCPQCGKFIERYQQWLQHLEIAHYSTSSELRMHRITNTTNHYCVQCNKLLYTCEKSRLQRHRFTHLPYKDYFQCAFCSVKKQYKSEVLRHFICVHRKEFELSRAYLRKPVEWGARVPDNLNKELDELIARKSSAAATQKKGSDIIQKALMNINLEEETQEDQYARIKSQQQGKDNQQSSLPLEDLCNEIFEEIEKDHLTEDVPMLTATAAKRFEPSTPEMEETTIEHIKEEIDIKQEQDYIRQGEEIISIQIIRSHEGAEQEEESTFEMQSPKAKRARLCNSIATTIKTEPQTEIETIDTVEPNEEEERLNAMREQHISYLCPQCGIEIKKHDEWRQHVMGEHDLPELVKNSFKLIDKTSAFCLKCMNLVPTAKFNDLQRHHFTHMQFQSYLKCTLCSKTKTSKPKLYQHFQTRHDREFRQMLAELHDIKAKHECRNCGRFFQTDGRWQNHRAHCLGRNAAPTENKSDCMRLIMYFKQQHTRIQKIAAAMNIDLPPLH